MNQLYRLPLLVAATALLVAPFAFAQQRTLPPSAGEAGHRYTQLTGPVDDARAVKKVPEGTHQPRPTRVALVLGNAAYRDAPLANPVNDARDMVKVLGESGFKVIQRKNAGLKEMHLALREFGDALSRESTGLFYFAGHGMQVRGRNYLIPVDADIAREDEVAFNALDLAAVLEKMESSRNHTNFLILDACRNNPFVSRFRVSTPGLAQIDAPAGSLIAFSTAPGSVAADGAGRNGLYTKHLLENISRPGVRIEDAFKAVRIAVRRESGNLQTPWESTSLEGEFYFRAPARVAKPAPPQSPPRAAPKTRPVSLGSAPRFAVGDTWTWRVNDHLNRGQRMLTLKVTEIRDDEVVFNNTSITDLNGNLIRHPQGDRMRKYTPSTLFYLFPMTQGASWTLKHTDEAGDRITDVEVQISVKGEEEVSTPAGKMKAIKVERIGNWRQRKTGSTGISAWTYWYTAQVKRWVRAEWTNTATGGRVLNRETQELQSYRVE